MTEESAPTNSPAPARPDNRFIPVRTSALARAIAEDPDRFAPVAPHARAVAEAIRSVIGQECIELHRWLDELYAPVNPDADTLDLGVAPDAEAQEQRLMAAIRYVLDKANFGELSDVQIEEAIRAGTTYGVRVRINAELVRSLTLFVRGLGREPRRRRRRWRPWKWDEIEVQVYRRLAVVTHLAAEDGVRFKLFRDIPVIDVEGLLPHAEIRMTALDRAKVFAGGAGSLGGAAKIALGGAFLSKLLVPLAIGLAGLGVKSFFGYRRTKHMRTSQRASHLYNQNLANNGAVIDALIRMIAQEETKEAFLAYAHLASWDGAAPRCDRLDETVERWLAERFGVGLNFDCPDALETLERLGLLDPSTRGGVATVDRAIATLGDHWHEGRTRTYHLDRAGAGPATAPISEPHPGPT